MIQKNIMLRRKLNKKNFVFRPQGIKNTHRVYMKFYYEMKRYEMNVLIMTYGMHNSMMNFIFTHFNFFLFNRNNQGL